MTQPVCLLKSESTRTMFARSSATMGDWTERAYGERKQLVQAEIESLYALDRRKYEGDYAIRIKDGTTRIWEFSSAPLGRLPDGRRLVISMAQDVTERRRTDDQLRKLARAVEQSPVSIMITDRVGNIEFVNPKFTQVTGYTRTEVLGKNPRVLKSSETPADEYARLWATISAGREWRGEFHNRRKDGTLFWETASISPMRDGCTTGSCSSCPCRGR